jgi:hypothetical protein
MHECVGWLFIALGLVLVLVDAWPDDDADRRRETFERGMR